MYINGFSTLIYQRIFQIKPTEIAGFENAKSSAWICIVYDYFHQTAEAYVRTQLIEKPILRRQINGTTV